MPSVPLKGVGAEAISVQVSVHDKNRDEDPHTTLMPPREEECLPETIAESRLTRLTHRLTDRSTGRRAHNDRLVLDMGISENGGTPYIPQDTIYNSCKGAPKRVHPYFRKPPSRIQDLNPRESCATVVRQKLVFSCSMCCQALRRREPNSPSMCRKQTAS